MQSKERPSREWLLWVGIVLLLALVAAPFLWTYLELRREYGDPEIVVAATNGDAQKVGELLRRGSPADSYHLEGSSALWWAVESNSPETVQVLLEHGADPNSKGQWNTVIDQAVDNLETYDNAAPNRRIIQLLLDRANQIKDPAQVAKLKDCLKSKAPTPTSSRQGRRQ